MLVAVFVVIFVSIEGFVGVMLVGNRWIHFCVSFHLGTPTQAVRFLVVEIVAPTKWRV